MGPVLTLRFVLSLSLSPASFMSSCTPCHLHRPPQNLPDLGCSVLLVGPFQSPSQGSMPGPDPVPSLCGCLDGFSELLNLCADGHWGPALAPQPLRTQVSAPAFLSCSCLCAWLFPFPCHLSGSLGAILHPLLPSAHRETFGSLTSRAPNKGRGRVWDLYLQKLQLTLAWNQPMPRRQARQWGAGSVQRLHTSVSWVTLKSWAQPPSSVLGW